MDSRIKEKDPAIAKAFPVISQTSVSQMTASAAGLWCEPNWQMGKQQKADGSLAAGVVCGSFPWHQSATVMPSKSTLTKRYTCILYSWVCGDNLEAVNIACGFPKLKLTATAFKLLWSALCPKSSSVSHVKGLHARFLSGRSDRAHRAATAQLARLETSVPRTRKNSASNVQPENSKSLPKEVWCWAAEKLLINVLWTLNTMKHGKSNDSSCIQNLAAREEGTSQHKHDTGSIPQEPGLKLFSPSQGSIIKKVLSIVLVSFLQTSTDTHMPPGEVVSKGCLFPLMYWQFLLMHIYLKKVCWFGQGTNDLWNLATTTLASWQRTRCWSRAELTFWSRMSMVKHG